jgi:uncharacterized protein YndB with AHSA1/START domain
MNAELAVHDTFVLTRIYPHPAARVFAAFADPAKTRRWYAEGDHHDIETFALDFRVGGAERALYRFRADTPFPGRTFANEGVILDIVADRRIVTGSAMAMGDSRFSASLVTIELVPEGAGTKLICTHHGSFFEGADGPAMRRQGWEKLLGRLGDELGRS